MPPILPFIPLIATAAGAVLNHNMRPAGAGGQSSDEGPGGLTGYWRNQGYDAGAQLANTPLAQNSQTGGALGYDNQGQALGAQGMAAVGGDQGAMDKFMNPWVQSVVNRQMSRWGDLSANALNQAGDQAMGQGAYGGTRGALMGSAALTGMSKDQADQMAQLYSSGYDRANANAQYASNLGFASNTGAQNLGDYQANAQNQQAAHKYQTIQNMVSSLPQNRTQSAQSTVPGGSKAMGGLLQGLGSLPNFGGGGGAASSTYMPGGSNFGSVNDIGNANQSVPISGK